MFNCNLEGFTGPNTCRMKIVTQNLSERISSTQHSCHIATSDHWRCSRRDASLSPALNVRASNDAVLQYTFCMFKQGWRHISEFCINFAIILITKFYGPLMTLWSYLLCVRFDTWVCTLLFLQLRWILQCKSHSLRCKTMCLESSVKRRNSSLASPNRWY